MNTQINSRLRRFGAEAALIALCFYLFFWNLGGAPLLDYDEALYVTCAQQMVLTGDWITPRLNTRLPERPGVTRVAFFEKPIFVYWASASSMRLFGRNMWAARLPVAVVALITTLIVCGIGRRWFGRRAGLLAALTYATAPMTLVDARQMTTDGLLVLWITLAMLSFWKAQQRSEQQREKRMSSTLAPFLFWLACALAVLTKGAVGLLLPFLILGIYLLLERLLLRIRVRAKAGSQLRFALQLRSWRVLWQGVTRLRPLTGGLLFLLVIAPWHLLIARSHEHDAQSRTWWMEYILRQHVGRFQGLDAVHNQPLPTFFLYFLLGFFPWAGFVPAAFRNLKTQFPAFHRGAIEGNRVRNRVGERGETTFLLVWFWTIFVFFSLGAAKLPTYITPAYPAAALLLGRWLDRALPGMRKAEQNIPLSEPTDPVSEPTDPDVDADLEAVSLEWDRNGKTLRRGVACACVVGLLLLITGIVVPGHLPPGATVPAELIRFACHVALLFALGSGIAWGCFAGAGKDGRLWGIGVLAVMMVLVIGVVSGEGYAAARKAVFDPYQRLAIAARPDAQAGVPVVFYHIVPRRPSMLFYAGYAPFERKETPLLPFLASCLTPTQRQADVITPWQAYTHLLQPEVKAIPGATIRLLQRRGTADGWVLARIFVPKTYVPPPLLPHKESLWTPVSY